METHVVVIFIIVYVVSFIGVLAAYDVPSYPRHRGANSSPNDDKKLELLFQPNRSVLVTSDALGIQDSGEFDGSDDTTTQPMIAYKRAMLLTAAFNAERYFTDVTGTTYRPDDQSTDEEYSFHAYKTFQEALEHPQDGNVLLEVLLSGEIKSHRKGYNATHQRVLQVIVDTCSVCGHTAQHYAHEPHINHVIFLCEAHLQDTLHKMDNGRILNSTQYKPKFGKVLDLSNGLPWIDEHQIVVAKRYGEHNFVPTKIKSPVAKRSVDSPVDTTTSPNNSSHVEDDTTTDISEKPEG